MLFSGVSCVSAEATWSFFFVNVTIYRFNDERFKILLYFDLRTDNEVKPYSTTTMDKIFEISSSFRVKYRTTAKFLFLFFSSFLLVLTKFLFWEED